jgi:hypothetical protein
VLSGAPVQLEPPPAPVAADADDKGGTTSTIESLISERIARPTHPTRSAALSPPPSAQRLVRLVRLPEARGETVAPEVEDAAAAVALASAQLAAAASSR